MLNIDKGEITIDGKNIEEHDLANLRQKIGYVPQDVFLFSDDVALPIVCSTTNNTSQYTNNTNFFTICYLSFLTGVVG